jgi:hypothetical protein
VWVLWQQQQHAGGAVVVLLGWLGLLRLLLLLMQLRVGWRRDAALYSALLLQEQVITQAPAAFRLLC